MSVEDIDDGHILGKESLNKLIASVSTEKTVTTITAKEFLARREKQTSDKAKAVVRCSLSQSLFVMYMPSLSPVALMPL